MRYRATLTIRDSPEMEEVLRPEMDEEIPRSKIRMKKEGNDLVIEIEATDISALRAALSSQLRWISAAMSAKNIMEE